MNDNIFSSSVGPFSFLQTFFADPAAVGNSPEMLLTSISLFVKNKAPARTNIAGVDAPGCTLAICAVRDDAPLLNKVHRLSFVYKRFDEITASDKLPGTDFQGELKFVFKTPLILETGQSYGIVIIFDTPEYELHMNRTGDKIIGTKTTSSGSPSLGSFGPALFKGSNSGKYTPIADTDLACRVNVGKYVANNVNVQFTTPGYEFLVIANTVNNFLVGEQVYQDTANAAGTVAVTQSQTTLIGTGTSFTSIPVNSKFVIKTANVSQIVTANSVANNTLMTIKEPARFSNTAAKYVISPVGEVYYTETARKRITLSKSTAANSSFKFVANSTIKGELSNATAVIANIYSLSVDSFVPKLVTTSPATSKTAYSITLADGANGAIDLNRAIDILPDRLNEIKKYDAHLLSRSLEVENSNLYGADRRSCVVDATLSIQQSANNLYSSPTIDIDQLDLYLSNNAISSSYTGLDANGIVIDTEVGNAGVALTRHIGKSINFANNTFAEDLRVFVSAYRPQGTSVRLYARLYNSADPDRFEDKQWTPLELISNINKFSSLEDPRDFIEYEFGLPSSPPSAITIPGTFTTTSGNTNIQASSDSTSYIAANDLFKIYSPIFPDNYEVGVVSQVNSSIIVAHSAFTNTNVIGAGLLMERLLYRHTAFNNVQNDGISRYYNQNFSAFDKFDAMQIKIVLLADTTYIVPKVDQVQVIGVSA